MITNASTKFEPRQSVGLRDFLALGVTGVSVLGVIALSIVLIYQSGEQKVDTILAAVLPLLGSWVGTVLAYYFSKDNFEAANRSLSDMVDKMSPPVEKLKSVHVTDKMITKGKIFYKTLVETPQTKLVEILQKFNESNEVWSRLPILDEQGCLKYIIHRTVIDKFLVDKLWNPDPSSPKTIDQFTVQDLLGEPKYQKLLETNFAMVGEESTLADVKELMDAMPECKDVFITKTGSQDEPLSGWITNAIVIENAQL
jgi:hypothetical protein